MYKQDQKDKKERRTGANSAVSAAITEFMLGTIRAALISYGSLHVSLQMHHTHSQGSVEASATLKNGKFLLIQHLDQSFSKKSPSSLSSK